MHAFSMITDFRLKVFETVARRLNFTRAAEELFITQPAVTRHIKELERLLDARLFKREGPVRPASAAGPVQPPLSGNTHTAEKRQYGGNRTGRAG